MPEPRGNRPSETGRARTARWAFRLVLTALCVGLVLDTVLRPTWELHAYEKWWTETAPWWNPPGALVATRTQLERAVHVPQSLARFLGALAGVGIVLWLIRRDRTV